MVYVIGLLILSFLIVTHEFGHFLLARSCGVCVNEFAVGMGPALWKKVSAKTGTVYSVRLFPLGGFCAMRGESDDKYDSDGSFQKAKLSERFAIVAAGPLFNLIVAFLIGVVLVSMFGQQIPVITEVSRDTNVEIPLQEGDIIVSFDGNMISTSGEFLTDVIFMNKMDLESADLIVNRDGKPLNLSFETPSQEKYLFGFRHTISSGKCMVVSLTDKSVLRDIGVEVGDVLASIDGHKISEDYTFQDYEDEFGTISDREYDMVFLKPDGTEIRSGVVPLYQKSHYLGFSVNTERVPGGNVLRGAMNEFRYGLFIVNASLQKIFSGQVAFKDISGPVAMVSLIGDDVAKVVESGDDSESQSAGMVSLMSLIIMISANLGVLNLLPIPALDGGRLLFLLIELIRRKPVPVELENKFHRYGMVALMSVMVVILIKDMIPVWKTMIDSIIR